MKNNVSQMKLDKTSIPIIGLGTWQLKGQTVRESVKYALDVGYRAIDTADAYDNHSDIGEAVAKSGVSRKDLFITSKIWRTDLEYHKLKKSFDRILNELKMQYVDLLLVHWPNSDIPIEETLESMNDLKIKGKIHNIGVSNFTIAHIKEASQKSDVKICNNQIEVHPTLYQKDLIEFCEENGILVMAYSPIAQGEDLEIDIIKELSEKYGKTPAQIVLNWHISQGRLVVPRSSSRKHINENLDVLGWRLSEDDLEKIDKLDRGNRIVDPAFGEFNN